MSTASAVRQSRVLIAGGGIGGLTAALALIRRGIDVQVFEQAHALREVGAGVQISANGARALHALGIGAEVTSASCEASGKEIRLWSTGQSWTLFDLGAESVRQYGFPYLTVYRPDLLEALAHAVQHLRPGAIRLGTAVTSFTQDGSSVTLHLADGSEAVGDALIGADGIHSCIRQSLFGQDAAEFSGLMAWRGVIPMGALPAHLARPVGTNWVGPGRHVVHYPLRRGELMNFVGIVERSDWQVESWTARGSTEELTADFAGWHPDVHAMIRAIEVPYKWALMLRKPLARWTNGRVTLLGDACHPTLPRHCGGTKPRGTSEPRRWCWARRRTPSASTTRPSRIRRGRKIMWNASGPRNGFAPDTIGYSATRSTPSRCDERRMKLAHDHILLVGSVPLETAENVFDMFGTPLGEHLCSMPDGEVGPRSHWISRLHYQVLALHPGLEIIRRPALENGVERLNPRDAGDSWQFRVRPGAAPIRFGDPGWRLGFAREALNSYFVFRTLRAAGRLAPHLRFQVSIPSVVSALPPRIFPEPGDVELVREGYAEALRAELRMIVERIPAEELAVQWDCATEVQDAYGSLPGLPAEGRIERNLEQFRQLSPVIPEAALLGFHLCFGTLGGWPRFSPDSLDAVVDLANAVVEACGRRVDWVHIPVLDRDDDAFFAPLAQLRPRGARIYLGAIHHMDGFEQRIATARKFLPDFGVAAYCGFGRTPPAGLAEILQDHQRALTLVTPA